MSALNPLISVIIPTYNRAHCLMQAYESVVAQSYDNIEVIIVDDGSTDDTAHVVEGITSESVRYIWQENSGPSQARNTGIRNTTGQYIAFLDSDDVWLPGKLRKQMACFECNENIGLVASAYNGCNEMLEIIKPMVSEVTSSKKIRKLLPVRNFLPTPSVIVKKECLDRVGCFDESLRFAEDWDLWIRIAQEYEILYLHEPLVNVRNSTESLSSSNTDYNDEVCHYLNNKYCTTFLQKLQAESWRNLNKAFVCSARGKPAKEIGYLIKSLLLWPCSLGYRYLMLANKLVKYFLRGVSQRY